MLYVMMLLLSGGAAATLLMGINLWWKKDILRGFAYVTLAFFILSATIGMSVVQGVGIIFDEKVKQHNLETFFYDEQRPKG